MDEHRLRFTLPIVKICVIGPTYPFRGGIAHYTTLLVRHLRAAGHQVQFYSYLRQYPRFLFPGKSDREPSATALREPCEYIVDPLNPLTWWCVFRRIQRDAPDLLLLQWWTPYWTPSLVALARLIKRRTTIRLVFVCHNVLPHEERGWLDRWLAWLTLRRGDAFIVHSEQDRARLQALLPRAVVHRVQLPTYAELGSLSGDGEANVLRHQLALEGKRILLFFGLVRPYKGVSYLLQALPQVVRRLPDVHLLIVGEWWDDRQASLEQVMQGRLARHITVVDRYVPNEELGAYFGLADAVVLPYVSATGSAVAQLALSFGVPVITTQVGGLADAVQHEHTGLLVPPGDAQALAAALVRYFTEDLGPAMRAHIAAEREAGRFAWDELVWVVEESGGGEIAEDGYIKAKQVT